MGRRCHWPTAPARGGRQRKRLRRCPAALLHTCTIALVLWTAVVSACASQGSEEPTASVIPRERFIAAYVDLRLAALRDAGGEVGGAQRDTILARHGVTAQDLLRFVEQRGSDPAFMSEVWDTIERRIREWQIARDTAGATPDSAPPVPDGGVMIPGDGVARLVS